MSSSKCTLQVNLRIIEENYRALSAECPNSETGAAVKANCYGLGAKQISPVLKQSGCTHFFVANIEEGVSLRKILGADINIFVLNGVFSGETKAFKEHGLVPILNHFAQIRIWQEFAFKLHQPLPCFKFNSQLSILLSLVFIANSFKFILQRNIIHTYYKYGVKK